MMKHIIFATVFGLLCITGTTIAKADNVTINRDPNGQVIQLPGNAQVLTGNSPSGVIIYNDDESLLYRSLVAPYARQRNYNGYQPVPNGASLNDVQSICGNNRNTSEQNKCIADVIKQREKLNRRYNN